MSTHHRSFARRSLNVAIATAVASLALASAAAQADQRVILTGTMTESETGPQPQNQMGGQTVTLRQVCDAASIAGQYAGMAEVELANQMARAGVPSDLAGEARESLGSAMEEICRDPDQTPESTSSTFTLIYAGCMMRMETPANGMAIRLVPDSGEAIMEMVDYNAGEAYNLLMNYDIGRLQSVTGAGEATDLSMESTGQAKSIIGYDTEEHTYHYTMSMGDQIMQQMGGDAGGAMAGMLGNMSDMMKVTTSGSAWLAADAPGADIVSDFYDNLAGITDDGLGNSFFSGMIRNLAGLVKAGIPLETRTRVQAPMGMNSFSTSLIETLQVGSMDSGECARTIVPEGYEVSSITEQIDEAMGGQQGAAPANAGMSAEQSAEANEAMNDAMGELNKAMENMTPEQREAMESMGLGGLFGGAAAADSGAAAGNAAAASGASAASAASADMMSDDLGQSAQRMLQALGYEPGNTSGNIDTATVVAISQFQAENGMAVTGEVTPQLIGVLSAKVDAK